MGDNPFFNALKTHSEKKPWKTAFLARFLFISVGLKDYVLALIHNPIRSYVASACVAHAVFALEVGMIQKEIHDFSDYVNGPQKSWDQLSLVEKISSVFIWILIVFTIGLSVYLGFKARSILKEKRANEERKEEVRCKLEFQKLDSHV